MLRCPLALATIVFPACLGAAIAADPAKTSRTATGGHAYQEKLDAAIKEFNDVIANEVAQLIASIEKTMGQAVDEDDLPLAKKCRSAKKAVEEDGEIPSDGFMRAAVNAGQRNIDRAANKLQAVFKEVSKEVLKGGDIEAAEAIQQECSVIGEQAKSAWRPFDQNESMPAEDKISTSRKGPIVKQAKPKPTSFRFVHQKAIEQHWSFSNQDWRLQNGGVDLGDAVCVSRKRYSGDLAIQILCKGHLQVKICGERFVWEGNGPVVVQRKGNVLSFMPPAGQPSRITLKDSQMGATSFELGSNDGLQRVHCWIGEVVMMGNVTEEQEFEP